MWHLLSVELARCRLQQSVGTTTFLAMEVVRLPIPNPATKGFELFCRSLHEDRTVCARILVPWWTVETNDKDCLEESESHDLYARRHAQLSKLARLQNLFTLQGWRLPNWHPLGCNPSRAMSPRKGRSPLRNSLSLRS